MERYYKIENKAGSADVLIYGTIGESWFEESVTARQLVTEIRNLEKQHDRINVRINSPGGSVFDGLAIFNALKNSTADIHTYNEGLAASMGAVILMAGGTVHAAKNSLTMLHSPSTFAGGNRRDFEDAIKVLDKVQNSLVESIAQHSDKKKEEIEAAYFDYNDHWLTADEAKQEGFVDEIDEKEAAVNKKMAAKSYREMMDHFSHQVTGTEKQPGKIMTFLNNLFGGGTSKDDGSTINSEMDIKQLQAALSLSDTATDQEVLDAVKSLQSGLTAEQAAKESAQKDLKTAQDNLVAEKSAKEQAVRDLETEKKKPGAAPAAVNPDTDNIDPKEDEPAKDFGTAYLNVMRIFKKGK